MTWKNAFIRALKKECQPMHQVTYWTIFLSCGFTFIFGVISGAALASYEIIIRNPEIAHNSWLVVGMF